MCAGVRAGEGEVNSHNFVWYLVGVSGDVSVEVV
jgi:hypothetical protein